MLLFLVGEELEGALEHGQRAVCVPPLVHRLGVPAERLGRSAWPACLAVEYGRALGQLAHQRGVAPAGLARVLGARRRGLEVLGRVPWRAGS